MNGEPPERASEPTHDPAPAEDLKFVRAEVRTSETAHATSTRGGRVARAPRRYATLVQVARLKREQCSAHFVHLPEGTEHVVLESMCGSVICEVWSLAGARMHAHDALTGNHVLVRPERYFFAGDWFGWGDGGREASGYGGVGAEDDLLASSLRGDEWETLVTKASPPHGNAIPDRTRVAMERPFEGRGRTVWEYVVDEPGVGAIDASGQVAIALESGRFVVLMATGNGGQRAVLGTDARVEPCATDLSIVPPFAMVLYGGGDMKFLAVRREVFCVTGHDESGRPVLSLRQGRWETSRLDARRPDGSLAWRAGLPVRAEQPPIDGNGRVYVVGNGIVALDMNGKQLWSMSSPVKLRAQAFIDGTLAVVDGAELRIVGSDGAVKQSFRAEEELTSYPAIGSDGAVWVASAKALYVAR